MLKLSWRRWRWAVVAASAAVAAGVAGVLSINLFWSYLKYPDAEHRQAARHLDKVSVEGFDYLGEDASEYGSVSRFWLKRGIPDSGSMPKYDHRQLQGEVPGRSLSTSRYEQEIGWLSLRDDDPLCVLQAFRIRELGPGIDLTISGEDRNAIAAGNAVMIRVVVICGDG